MNSATPAQIKMKHDAWGRMCKAFEALTLQSVNEEQCRPLVSLIRLWGEELAVLRREQGDDGIEWGRNVREDEAFKLAEQGIVTTFSP